MVSGFPPSNFSFTDESLKVGFTDCEFEILILGSMPGIKSLKKQQYYAHPRNSFWWIMSQLLGFSIELSYSDKLKKIHGKGVLLWDVLKLCERQGSLDSAIKSSTEHVNDIKGVLSVNSSIKLIGFNGKKAREIFNRHFPDLSGKYRLIDLPSTSPAHAAMTKEQKLNVWRSIMFYHNSVIPELSNPELSCSESSNFE